MKALLDRRTDPTWMLYAAIIAWLLAPRPAIPRRSGVPPFSGEIPSFRRQHRQARPAQTFHPFAVKKTLSKKLIAACQYANALA